MTVIIVFLNCITGPNPSTTQTRNRNRSINTFSYYISKWSHSTYLMKDFWGFDWADVEVRSLMDQIEACKLHKTTPLTKTQQEQPYFTSNHNTWTLHNDQIISYKHVKWQIFIIGWLLEYVFRFLLILQRVV